MADIFDFAHFLRAQEGVVGTVLRELHAGAKRSHWMWFVFPQIQGLGAGSMAQRFGLADRDEACAYAAHPVLGDRLERATEAMLAWAGKRSAEAVLGQVDAMKLRSSMTLFEAACPDTAVFAATLDAFYGGERDAHTLARL